MSRFAQHTRLVATPGRRDELVAKFLEAAEIQRGNPDCELMLVSTAPDSADVVFLTEIWSSENAWEQARNSAGPGLGCVDARARQQGLESVPLEVAGGRALASIAASVAIRQEFRRFK